MDASQNTLTQAIPAPPPSRPQTKSTASARATSPTHAPAPAKSHFPSRYPPRRYKSDRPLTTDRFRNDRSAPYTKPLLLSTSHPTLPASPQHFAKQTAATRSPDAPSSVRAIPPA